MKKTGGWNAYFISDKGRRLTFRLASGTAIALFVGNFIPQALFVDKIKEIVQCYRMGAEKQLSENIKKRLELAYGKLQVSKFERNLLKPFVVYGFDDFSAGSTKYQAGAIIGIPSNYFYESPSDINTQDVRFRNNLIDWNSESGQLLKEALVLKEDEQIFGICKSILQAQSHQILFNSLYATAAFIMCYASASSLNRRFNFYARPMSLRLTMYTFIGLFGFGVWTFAKDFTQVYSDGEIDRKLSELGPEFVEAGVRYYDKVLKKNMALRNLTGDNTYTARGNENFLLRQKALPLTFRKSYFETQLQELKDQLAEKKDMQFSS